MADIQEFLNDASESAKQATRFDTEGRHEAAIYMYRLAILYLFRALEHQPENHSLRTKANEYSKRCDDLQELGKYLVYLVNYNFGKIFIHNINQ